MPSRVCPFCHDRSHFTAVKGSASSVVWVQERMTLYQGSFRCDGCNRLNIATTVVQGFERLADDNSLYWADDPDGYTLEWYPVSVIGKSFPDVPEHIASAADEAYRCQSIGAHRAAGALARAVVEATSKEKGITVRGLDKKIEEMEKQGLVRKHVRAAADEVRHLGNDMAHGDFVDPVDAEEAAEVLQLMSEVLDEVFQSPARVQARREARLAKKPNNPGKAES